VTVETILRQKGTDVATIEPKASIRRAADWLRVKNIGALVVTVARKEHRRSRGDKREGSSRSHFRT
jgi:hypothetical protein